MPWSVNKRALLLVVPPIDEFRSKASHFLYWSIHETLGQQKNLCRCLLYLIVPFRDKISLLTDKSARLCKNHFVEKWSKCTQAGVGWWIHIHFFHRKEHKNTAEIVKLRVKALNLLLPNWKFVLGRMCKRFPSRHAHSHKPVAATQARGCNFHIPFIS